MSERRRHLDPRLLAVRWTPASSTCRRRHRPPGTGGGLREILRDNLFKDVKNSVLTVMFGLVLAYVLVRSMTFLFVTARWEVIVDGPLVFYMVGNDFANTGISYEMLWAGIYVAVLATALAVGLAYRPTCRRCARAPVPP